MKWGARYRSRLRKRILGAHAGWKDPQRVLAPSFPFHPGEGAYWNEHLLFTQNRSVLGIFVHVSNEDLREPGRWLAAARISNIVRGLARNAIHDESERRITERVAGQVRHGN